MAESRVNLDWHLPTISAALGVAHNETVVLDGDLWVVPGVAQEDLVDAISRFDPAVAARVALEDKQAKEADRSVGETVSDMWDALVAKGLVADDDLPAGSRGRAKKRRKARGRT